jgi:hypothetical protein
MNTSTRIALLTLVLVGALAQAGEFTYQGRLTNEGLPADGSYSLRLTLYDVTNASSWNFSVEVTTNLMDWEFLGPAFSSLSIPRPAGNQRSAASLPPALAVNPPSADERLTHVNRAFSAASRTAHGLYELYLTLYDAPTDGNVIGTPAAAVPVPVCNYRRGGGNTPLPLIVLADSQRRHQPPNQPCAHL